jgi:SAM-dependent methyltransferase
MSTSIAPERPDLSQHAIAEVMRRITGSYPAMPGRNALDDPHHETYLQRSAFDAGIVAQRLGTDITVVDIGGGLGLFSLGMAALGARSILVDDFVWLRQQPFSDATFELFEKHRVEVVERDVIADGLELPGKVDAVANFHFMEHVHNSPKPLFHDIADHLVPGGLFVLAGPNNVNLRKRITVPLGKGKWTTMENWYEAPVFRGHVREPDVDDLRYIARDMRLDRVEILGRNFLGMSSNSPVRAFAARTVGQVLQRRPSLCSDIYLVARKP